MNEAPHSFRHNAWATRQMLLRCRELSRDQLHERFDIGPGSVHDTFQHVIGAMFRWSDRTADRDVKPSIEKDGERTVDELLTLLADAEKSLETVAVDVTKNNRGAGDNDVSIRSSDTPGDSIPSLRRIDSRDHARSAPSRTLRYMLRRLGIDFGNDDFDPIEWERSTRC